MTRPTSARLRLVNNLENNYGIKRKKDRRNKVGKGWTFIHPKKELRAVV
jgi:hypothetical protein